MKAGAPENCIQWIDTPSIEATGALMNHPGVATILATGGPGMVKAAYSCGKPALGVGPGNVPCYIEKSADLHRACTDLMMSKTFDNGMICASEQAVIVDKEIAKDVRRLYEGQQLLLPQQGRNGKADEIHVPGPQQGRLRPAGGQICKLDRRAGRPEGARKNEDPHRAHLPQPDENHPLAKEKLCPGAGLLCCKQQAAGL